MDNMPLPPHVEGRPDTWHERLPDRMDYAPWPDSPLWIVDAMEDEATLLLECVGYNSQGAARIAKELRAMWECIAGEHVRRASHHARFLAAMARLREWKEPERETG